MITASLASLAAGPDTTVSAGPLFQIVEPYLVSGLGALITALIAWAASALQRWTCVKIDEAHREALHSAAMTGVNMALARLGATADSLTIDTRSAVIAQAVAWMEKSVPDALVHFGMTPGRLADLVESKIGLLAQPAAARAGTMSAIKTR